MVRISQVLFNKMSCKVNWDPLWPRTGSLKAQNKKGFYLEKGHFGTRHGSLTWIRNLRGSLLLASSNFLWWVLTIFVTKLVGSVTIYQSGPEQILNKIVFFQRFSATSENWFIKQRKNTALMFYKTVKFLQLSILKAAIESFYILYQFINYEKLQFSFVNF